MKINTGRKIQHLAVHNLVKNYGYSFCCILPALHYLTGSKNTSKIGTKLKAIESNPHEYLINFGSGQLILSIFCMKLSLYNFITFQLL